MPWPWDLGKEHHHSRSDFGFCLLSWFLMLRNEGIASYVVDKVLCHWVPSSSLESASAPLWSCHLTCGCHLLLHCLPGNFHCWSFGWDLMVSTSRSITHLNPLELELKEAVDYLQWVQETELGSSRRAASSLNRWAVSPALRSTLHLTVHVLSLRKISWIFPLFSLIPLLNVLD